MELTTTKIPSGLLLSPMLTFIFKYMFKPKTLRYSITKSIALKNTLTIGADPHRFPSFYENRSDFSEINIFLMKKKILSKLKSGQYPV